MTQEWKTYEEVSRNLLNQFAHEFGVTRFEGKQLIDGLRSGTKWEIEAKGIRDGNAGFIIVECRRYTTSKQNQEKIGALAYRIIDTNASGGIIVSPYGLQKGAEIIANSENIVSVLIDENSTEHEFCIKFLNKLMLGITERICITDSCSAEVTRICNKCSKKFTVNKNEEVCPDCNKL